MLSSYKVTVYVPKYVWEALFTRIDNKSKPSPNYKD